MKHFLLSCLTALAGLGTAFNSFAVDPVTNYKEDFTTLYKGYTSGNMARSSYAYPAHYWIREGSTTKNLNVGTSYDATTGAAVKRCVGWTVANQGTASSSSEALVTPKVGGKASFYVHRCTSSTTSTYATEVDIFKMTVDANGTWTRTLIGSADGNFGGIVLSGVNDAKSLTGADYTDNDNSKWRKIEISNIPDGTYIGIHLNGLWMDDFEADKAWLEWPSYVWDGTIIPYIDVAPLGTTYTKYYLDSNNNFLNEQNQPYMLEVQLKQTINAGKPTEDMFKYRFQFSVTGQDPLRLTDKDGNDIIAEFEQRPTTDWTTLSSGDISHEEKTIAFALYDLDPKYFNTNCSFQAVKVGPDGNDVGAPISMQRKNTVGTNGVWNATSWSNFQFEALVPQPFICYTTNNVTNTTTASSLKSSTLSDYHAWFINPISNEAPIYMGNSAGRANMKITRVEFSSPNFGLKDNLSFPLTVDPDKVVAVKPSVKATQPGIYKGTMSVYVEGTAEPFVAKLEGAVKPDYETSYIFHNPNGTANAQMPAGWLATGNWQIASLSAAYQKVDGAWTQAASTFGTTPGVVVLSSPKISFEEGAEVWFDATCYQATGEMEVVYSTDRANWQVLKKMTVAPVTPSESSPITDDMFNSFFYSKGSYNENLFKTFYVEVPQAGEGYIAFRTASNQARVDNVVIDGTPVEVDFDIAYISQNIPAKFALNKPKDVSVTFRNLLPAIPAGEYDIQVVADGTVARTFSGDKVLTTGADVELATTYAFASEGPHTLSFNLVKGENTVSSAEVSVNVVDEGYDEVFRVGASHTNNRLCEDYNSWPLTPNTGYAVTSEAIYPKSWLQNLNSNGASADNGGLNFDPNAPMTGLKEGDKITSIAWLGYAGASVAGKTSVEIPVEVYIENTTSDSFANNSETFKEGLTQVFKGTAVYDLTKTNSGTYTNATTPLVDTEEGFLKVIFDQPFTYTGENIRIQLRLPQVAVDESKAVGDIEFFDWTNNGTSIAGSLWAIEARGISSNDSKYRLMYQSGNTSRTVNALLPMLLMSKETPATLLTGTVTNSKTSEGIEGVTVKATSVEGVTFTATTGEYGTYTMEVGNAAFDFTITAEADHYYPYTSTETVNLATGNQEHNISLRETAIEISGVVEGKDGPLQGATVTLSNSDTGFSTLTATTGEGGTYSFKTELLNTTYTVKAEAQYYVAKEVSVAVTDVDKTVDNIVLTYPSAKVWYAYADEDEVTYNSATIWLTPGFDNVPEGASVYLVATNTANDVAIETLFTGNSQYEASIELNDLDAETEYTYNVTVEIRDGQTVIVASAPYEVQFTTLAKPIEAKVLYAFADEDEITDNSAVIWLTPKFENVPDGADVYLVATNTANDVAIETLFTGNSQYEASIELNDLDAETEYTYNVTIEVRNGAQVLFTSAPYEVKFTTLAKPIEAKVWYAMADDVTYESAIIYVTPGFENVPQGASVYLVATNTANEVAIESLFTLDSQNEGTIELYDLDPETEYTYEITIEVRNGAQVLFASAPYEVKFATLAKPVPAIDLGAVTANVNDGVLSVEFTYTTENLPDDATVNVLITSDEPEYSFTQQVSDSPVALTFDKFEKGTYTVVLQAVSNGDVVATSNKQTYVLNEDGIASIENVDPEARYFNINGVEVKNPAPGNFYIKVKANEATKVLVK